MSERKPELHRFPISVGDGGSDVAVQTLPEGQYLTHLALGYDAVSNKPPVRAFVGLQKGRVHTNLVGGWVRSTSVPTHDRDPTWTGRIKIPDQASLRLVMSNFTGSSQEIFCYYTLEAPP